VAVAAKEYAIAQGQSLSVARPGAANASGCVMLIAVAAISDKLSGGHAPPAAWTQLYAYSANRATTYGHYVNCVLYGKIGSASESATYVLTSTGTAANTVGSAASYRITTPYDATTLANNVGVTRYIQSLVSNTLYWQSATLTGAGSVVIDICGMLAASDANAATLALRTGDTETVRHRQVETDATLHWLSAAHGYRENQSGSLALETQTVAGNLGAMAITVEVKQSAASGGPSGGAGRVMYIGV
jgi:hypothetical protein